MKDTQDRFFLYPQDLTAAVSLKIAFRKYSWRDVFWRNGLRLKSKQVVGYSPMDGDVREFLLQAPQSIFRVLIKGPQPIDQAVELEKIPQLSPATKPGLIKSLFLIPARRQQFSNLTVLSLSALVLVEFFHRLAEGQYLNLISLPLVATTLLAGPSITLVSVILNRQPRS